MDKVLCYIQENHMLETGDKVIVGVSGGADSVCLLFLLKSYAPIFGLSLEVVHMEHGIRGKESLQDAEYVENLCREWKIPFHLYRRNIPVLAKEWKCSEEEAGRRVRYEAFEEVRRRTGAEKIAVAHNQDDQAETILFNLARGSGLRGLCGILPVRDRIIRPLLCLSRREIEEILKEAQIGFRTDATNQEEIYTRNKIRLNILPLLEAELNSSASLHIAQAGERLWKLESYFQQEAARRADLLCRKENGRILLDREAFLKEPEALQDYILRECLNRTDSGGHVKDLAAVHFSDLKKLAANQSGRFLNLSGGLRAGTEGGRLVFWKEKTEKENRTEVCLLTIPGETSYGNLRILAEIQPYKNEIIPEKMYTKWFDYDKITNAVQLRTRQQGDYLAVTPAGGTKTLKKYFIDEKIPASQRQRAVLLADGKHIIWVIGHRISTAYKADEKTRRVLKVQVLEG